MLKRAPAPAHMRNLSASLIMPLAYFFGAGFVPAVIAFYGDRGSFAPGFLLMGGATVLGLFLLKHLKNE